MSVRVRLTRVGSKKNPIWRVVVADQRSPRDGRIIESIGHYNPQTEPSTIVIDRDRLEHWMEKGAQPTNTVRKLLRAPNTVAKVAVAEPRVAPEVEAAPDGGEAGTVPTPEDTAGAELPAEGEDTPAGSAGSEADAGPSGAAVEPAEPKVEADGDAPPADPEATA